MSIELHKKFLKYSLLYLYKGNYLWRMPCLEGVGGRTNGCIGGPSWDSASLEEHLGDHSEILVWPKTSFAFFYNILHGKNLNELFGQPNTSSKSKDQHSSPFVR